nr:PREDICTED: uncharacterized protein LOC105662607 [Megachile rotundata]
MGTLICCTLLDQFPPVLLVYYVYSARKRVYRTCGCLKTGRNDLNLRAGPTNWSIGRLTCSYYPRKLSFMHSHVPFQLADAVFQMHWAGEFRTACYETTAICGTLVPTSMAVTGYLGLPAEMANILLRPPTHSVTRSLGSLLFGVPCTHMIALSLDTYSLRVIIVIYAPTTNATSLI